MFEVLVRQLRLLQMLLRLLLQCVGGQLQPLQRKPGVMMHWRMRLIWRVGWCVGSCVHRGPSMLRLLQLVLQWVRCNVLLCIAVCWWPI